MEINQESVQQMQQSQLFGGVDSAELAEIYKIGAVQVKREGEHVVKESDEGDSFYWIKSGRLVVQINNVLKPEPLMLNVMKAGEVFGEMVLLGKTRRTASIIVKNEATLIVWKRDDVMAYFQKAPAVGYIVMTNLGKMLSDRLLDMNLQLRNHSELLGSNLSKYF